MITNTCLTGGSFELEPPEAGVLDPPLPLPPPPLPLPLPLEPDGEEDLPEAGFVPVAGVVVGAAADGVGSELAAGGSLAAGEAASGVVAVVVAAGAAAGGRISFTCRPASAASVSCTGEAVTLPIRTPNPRNASTSTAQTRGDGSERSPTRSLGRGRSEQCVQHLRGISGLASSV